MRSPGAQAVRAGIYQPPDRRQRRRTQLVLSFLPFMFALYLFTPEYKLGRPEPVVERAHRWRTVLAVLIGVGTTVPYFVYGRDKTSDVLVEPLAEAIITGMLLVPLFLVACVVLIVAGGRRWRADTFRQLLRPLSRVGAFVLTLVTFALFSDYVVGRDKLGAATAPAVLGLLWLLVFFLTSAFLVVRHLFNAVDGHPLLAPLYATLVAWWTIVQKLIYHAHSDRPLWLDLLLAFGGALVVTALSVWEVRRLARRGFTIRSGPYPPVPPRPTPPPGHPWPPRPGYPWPQPPVRRGP
jgi:hypothetical protein